MAKRRKVRKMKQLFSAAGILLCAAGLAFAFRALLSNVHDKIVDANAESLRELELHDMNHIRSSIVLRWETMEGAGKRVAARQWTGVEDLTDAENALLDTIPDADRLGLLDSEGTLYASTGLVQKNSDYKALCEGRTERFVLRLNTDARITEAEKEALIEAIPVSFSACGKEMEWMLCRFPISELESDLKIGSYDENGFTSVIDAEGNFILNVSETHSFGDFDSLFDGLEGALFEGYGSLDEARAAAEGDETVIYSLNGEKYLMVLSAFDFADWYIVSVVPASVFKAQTNAIILRFMLLLGILTVVLATVLYLVFRRKKELELAEQEKRLKEAEERKKLIDGITASYNVAYVVDMTDDSFEQLRMDKPIIGSGETFGSFTQAKEFFISLLNPLDRDRMRELLDYDTIRRKLTETSFFEAEYRLPVNGAMIWHRMNVSAIDEDTVTIGFAVDDLEITKKHLEDKRFSEYFALYEIDLDTETAKIVIDSPFYPVDRAGAARPYKAAILAFADTLEGEAKEFFTRISDIEVMKTAFANEDKYSYTYRSGNVEEKWVDLTSFVTFRHADGTPAMFTLGFSYIDSFGAAKQELQSRIARQNTKLEEALTFANFFLAPYDSAYYVSLNDLTWRAYKRPLLEKDEAPAEENYVEVLSRYVNTRVRPDYRELLSILTDPEQLRARLSANRQLTMDYPLLSGKKEKWYRCFATRGANADYVALGFLNVTDEIEERNKREKVLTDAIELAEKASKAKTEFLFNMSHDIRTPMNAILGYTDIGLRHCEDAKRTKDSFIKIKSAGGHLLNLINDILKMSRIESGKVELAEEPVDVRAAAKNILYMSESLAAAKGIDLKIEIGSLKNPYLYADELHVSEVIVNLISNAVKYTPEGGRVSFSVSQISDVIDGRVTYRFEVADNGIGMSEEFQRHLFESFSREQTSTVSKIEGTGLGLSIVKKIVDMSGGVIRVRSRQKVGSVFTVEIPFTVMDAAAIEAFRASNAVEEEFLEGAKFDGKKVLLVEDNEMNREIAAELLEESGLTVDTAENGEAAVQAVLKHGIYGYDFILMDIQMPVMNGYEATRAIRALPNGNGVPIIALSANAFAEDKAASLAAGMNDHVAKPIDPKELMTALARFL